MCAGRAICIVPFDTFIFQETLINRRLNRISTHPIHNLYPHILCLIEDLLNIKKVKLKFCHSKHLTCGSGLDAGICPEEPGVSD